MAIEQHTEAWLKQATAEQITAAERAGELDDLLGRTRNGAGNSPEQLRGIFRGHGGG